MSTIQAQAIASLRDLGWSLAEIGRHVKKDSSLISQIASGKRGPNYGNSLAGELHALVEPATVWKARGVPHPVPGSVNTHGVKAIPRKAKSGHLARTRQKMTRDHDLWGVSNLKKQATRKGARSLAPQVRQAAEKGRRGGLTLTLSSDVNVLRSGGRLANSPSEVEVVCEIPDLDGFADLIDAHGGNVTEAIAEYITENGNVQEVETNQFHAIEFRSWTD